MNTSDTSVTLHAAPPDPLAHRLGYAGLLPFVGGAAFVWLLVGQIDPEPFSFLVSGLTAYGALIVSFLGGMRWGLVMRGTAAQGVPEPALRQALWFGIAYALAAWLALLMPPRAGLAAMGGLLIACYLADRKHYPLLGAQSWLTLRFRLSAIASLSCFLAAAQL